MSRKRKQRRTSPAAAAVLLVVCGGVALFSLRGQFGGGAPVQDAPAGAFVDDPAVAAEADVDTMAPGPDLLLRYGSWDPKQPVRMVFADLGVAAPAAAPGGEIAPPAPPWVGADPPTMHLGVLMVGDTVRRAVVDGRVVGLGDKVGRATIVAIQRDSVTTMWGSKRLTYDLDGDHPREFRAELQRRGTEQSAATSVDAGAQIQEKAK